MTNFYYSICEVSKAVNNFKAKLLVWNFTQDKCLEDKTDVLRVECEEKSNLL